MKCETINAREVWKGSNILKPNFHLNDGKLTINAAIKRKLKFMPLTDLVNDVYTCGIFKRVFVENKANGIPYISAQTMMDADPLENAKIISRKCTARLDELKTNQILISCAGSVGKVRLVSGYLDGVIGSQDIIRVDPSDKKFPTGFLYAYLSSPTIFKYIQSFIYGSVVPRIDPTTLRKLPVLVPSKKAIDEIDSKVLESYRLRNKAVLTLRKTVSLLQSRLPDFEVPATYKSNITTIQSSSRIRLDATFSQKHLDSFYKKIRSKGIDCKPIKELCHNVFTPNIFKRVRTESLTKNSVPYLGGAELLELHPVLKTFLSRKTKNIEDYILSKGCIAIQDSGSYQSMGYVSIVPPYLDGIAATNNLVRVIPNVKTNYNPYIFTFLKTQQGNKILKSNSYGTGQLHIDTKIIEDLLVPIIPEILKEIHLGVTEYLKLMQRGYELESESIMAIENELVSWQK
jgi:type I restriction enzyme S subunit